MPTLVLKDHYLVLGVDRAASQAEIKTAYRKRVREVHPDLLRPDASPEDVSEANELFKEVGLAWEYLQDPSKKKSIDDWLMEDLPRSTTSHDVYDSDSFWSRSYRPQYWEPIVVPPAESHLFDGVWCFIQYSADRWSGRLRATVRVPMADLFSIHDIVDLPHHATLEEVLAYDNKGDVVGRGYSL